MHPTWPTPSDSGPHWGHDTIYSEATCPPEEVFYEGSEDDDYESPTARKLRYAAAGRRFLDGEVPLILSAALEGPFEQSSGWVNPWRSRREGSGRIPTSASRASKVTRPGKKNHHPQNHLSDTQSSLECHLPSPESLKQETFEPHPFLEDDDVARVQDWRSTVQPMEATKDGWAETDSPSRRASTRKKRATSSGQRQVTPSKKRKTDCMSTELIQTPPNRRSQRGPVSSIHASNNTIGKSSFTSSFRGAPGRLPQSIGKTSLRRQASYSRQDDDELGAENELMEAPSSSFASSSRRFSSPPKRVSPKRAVWKTNCSDATDSEDELAQDKVANLRAAATLSSPTSIKNGLRGANNSLRASHDKNLPHQPREIATINAEYNKAQKTVLPSDLAGMEDSSINMIDSKISQETGATPTELEIRRDDSRSVRIQPETEAQNSENISPSVRQRKSSPLSSVLSSFDSKTWSGLSSPAREETLPNGGDISTQPSHTSDTSEIGDTSEEPGNNQPQNGSIIAHVANTPTRAHDWQTIGDVDEDQPMMSNDDTSSDTSSELSGPGSVESTIKAQFHVTQKKPGNEPTPGAVVERASSTSEAQVSQDQVSETGGSNSFSSDSCESREYSSDVPMEDINACTPALRDVSQDLTLQPGDYVTTITDLSMADPEVAGPVLDEPHPTASARALPLASLRNTSAEPPAPAPETISTGFSLKNALQRLVPVKSWRKSLSNDIEYPEQTITDMGGEYKELAQPSKLAQPVEAHIEAPKIQQFHMTGCEETLEVPVSQSAASGTLMIPGFQVAPESVGERDHKGSSPPPRADKEISQTVEQTASSTRHPEDSKEKGEAKDGPIALSQQSPWSKSQDTQWLRQVLNSTSTSELVDEQRVVTPSIEGNIPSVINRSELNHTPSYDDKSLVHPAANDSQPTTPPRLSTPESQFTLQPFSAFMTPSPERRVRKMQHTRWITSGTVLPSTQRILASAMKNPWNSAKPSRRVSWAPLPGHTGQDSPSRGSGDGDDTGIGMETRERAASPPPMTDVKHLPMSKDDDFQGHFNAVAKRANEAPRTILPTESQETENSSNPCVMVHDFLTTNTIGYASSDMAPPAMGNSGGEGEPMAEDDTDLTDQVFQDLEDLLRPWDLDAELDQAQDAPEFGLAEISA